MWCGLFFRCGKCDWFVLYFLDYYGFFVIINVYLICLVCIVVCVSVVKLCIELW